MQSQKVVGKLRRLGFIPGPRLWPHPQKTHTPLALRDIALVFGRLPLLIATGNLGRLGVLCAIQAIDGRKPLVPSSGLVIQVDTECRVVKASQVVD